MGLLGNMFGDRGVEKAFTKALLENAKSLRGNCPSCGAPIQGTFAGRNDAKKCTHCGRTVWAYQLGYE